MAPDRVPTALKSFSALQPPDTSGRVALTVCTATIVNLKLGTDSLLLVCVECNQVVVVVVRFERWRKTADEKKCPSFFCPDPPLSRLWRVWIYLELHDGDFLFLDGFMSLFFFCLGV